MSSPHSPNRRFKNTGPIVANVLIGGESTRALNTNIGVTSAPVVCVLREPPTIAESPGSRSSADQDQNTISQDGQMSAQLWRTRT
jgi:hypothetical protein